MKRKDKILAACVLTACVAGLIYLTIRYRNACARYEAYQAKKENKQYYVTDPPFGLNHILTNGNVSVYEDFGGREGLPNDDFDGPEEGMLIRSVDSIAKDTMAIVGPYNRVVGYDNFCTVVSGVDSVRFDITSPLPKSVDVRFLGMLPNCEKYTFTRQYIPGKNAPNNDFQINIGLPKNPPAWYLPNISEFIGTDLFDTFDNLPSKYYDENIYSASRPSAKKMAEHYYQKFRELYINEYDVGKFPIDSIYWFERRNIQWYIYPVWVSPDSTKITLRYYQYQYLGGAHGGIFDAYITYDAKTGRALRTEEILSTDQFASMMKKLEYTLYRRLVDRNSFTGRIDASYNTGCTELRRNEDVSANYTHTTDYPTPAITRNGIVFTYQTYEKGSNADGTLHFLFSNPNAKTQ